MLFTIIISVSILLITNFLLLKFSCNKIIKKVEIDKPPIVVLKPNNIISVQEETLAPTGS